MNGGLASRGLARAYARGRHIRQLVAERQAKNSRSREPDRDRKTEASTIDSGSSYDRPEAPH